MDVELKAAVERLTEWVGEPDRFEIQFATDLRTVLASLQAPCPGKGGELREKAAGIIDPLPFSTDWVGMPATREGRQQDAYERADAILALLSAQPVPGGDHVVDAADMVDAWDARLNAVINDWAADHSALPCDEGRGIYTDLHQRLLSDLLADSQTSGGGE